MIRALCVVALLVLAACDSGKPQQLPVEDLAILKSDGNSISFKVEVAETSASLQRGMMFKTEAPPNTGMIFVFDRTEPLTFWMKNTLIPLDMLFIDEGGTIVTLHENAIPHDETLIPSVVPARYVVEIAGGEAKRLGIAVGDRILFRGLNAGGVAPPQ